MALVCLKSLRLSAAQFCISIPACGQDARSKRINELVNLRCAPERVFYQFDFAISHIATVQNSLYLCSVVEPQKLHVGHFKAKTV